jgi:uncharacterized protein
MTKVCIDTNIWISGILFSGRPATVVSAAFDRKFQVVSSQIILNELEKNLLQKFDFSRKNTKRLIYRILQIADLYEPSGTIHVVPKKHTDNLILETALLGRAKYLVTGDKEHLLPLKMFKHIKIIDASRLVDELKLAPR